MEPKPPIIRSIDSPQKSSGNAGIFGVIIILVAILAGIGTGYGIKAFTSSDSSPLAESSALPSEESNATVVETAGIKDEKTFGDKAEGLLREGGIEGEGAFHLERPGGPSQNAYLTSTTVDLEPFVGKKVRVMGKTFQGKTAGWLMDVGYVEVLQ